MQSFKLQSSEEPTNHLFLFLIAAIISPIYAHSMDNLWFTKTRLLILKCNFPGWLDWVCLYQEDQVKFALPKPNINVIYLRVSSSSFDWALMCTQNANNWVANPDFRVAIETFLVAFCSSIQGKSFTASFRWLNVDTLYSSMFVNLPCGSWLASNTLKPATTVLF